METKSKRREQEERYRTRVSRAKCRLKPNAAWRGVRRLPDNEEDSTGAPHRDEAIGAYSPKFDTLTD